MCLNGRNCAAPSTPSATLPACFLPAVYFLRLFLAPPSHPLRLLPVVALFRLVGLPLAVGCLARLAPKPLLRLLPSLPGPNPFFRHISTIRVPRFIRMRLADPSRKSIGSKVSNRVIVALTVGFTITRVLPFSMTNLGAFIAKALIGLVFLVHLLLPLGLSLRGRLLVRQHLRLPCRSPVVPLGLLPTWRPCCLLST